MEDAAAPSCPEGQLPLRAKCRLPAWRMYGLFALGAVAIGIAAYGFTLLERLSGQYLHWAHTTSWVIPFLSAPVGLMLIIFLRNRLFAGTQGTGIPQTIAALKMGAGSERRTLLSLRIA
ncbi:MAG: hypothetical protein AAGA45_07460, partial [Verrucomicrobiota bacterium]